MRTSMRGEEILDPKMLNLGHLHEIQRNIVIDTSARQCERLNSRIPFKTQGTVCVCA
jgi:hypothetical protein